MLIEPVTFESPEDELAIYFKKLHKHLTEGRLRHLFLFKKEMFDFLSDSAECELWWYCECATPEGDHEHYHILFAYVGTRQYNTFIRWLRAKFHDNPRKRPGIVYTYKKMNEFRQIQCEEHLTQVIHYIGCNKGSTNPKYYISGRKHVHQPILTFDPHTKSTAQAKRNCNKVKDNIRLCFKKYVGVEWSEHYWDDDDKGFVPQVFHCLCPTNPRVMEVNSKMNVLDDVVDSSDEDRSKKDDRNAKRREKRKAAREAKISATPTPIVIPEIYDGCAISSATAINTTIEEEPAPKHKKI